MKTGLFFREGASMKRLLAFIFSMFIIALGVALLFIPDVKGNNFSLIQQIIGGSFIMVGMLLGLSTAEKFKNEKE